MRLEALLMLVVMCIIATSAIDFTVKIYDNTPGLYYDHVGQVQPYGSEWKPVTYVNISKLETTYNTVLDFIIQTKGMCKELSSEATSTCQSHLLLMEQSLSRVHRTHAIIFVRSPEVRTIISVQVAQIQKVRGEKEVF
jgi:hypothetical protein